MCLVGGIPLNPSDEGTGFTNPIKISYYLKILNWYYVVRFIRQSCVASYELYALHQHH